MTETPSVPQPQSSFSPPPDLTDQVKALVVRELQAQKQPSAWELLMTIEGRLGWKGRWLVRTCLRDLAEAPSLTRALREYVRDLVESKDLVAALQGIEAPKKEILSTIDSLFLQSKAYANSSEFQAMVSFMANFRDYKPFNNMLVRLQNPSCSFFATERDWKMRFGRRIKEDAHPLLILAPMRPVLLVYDLDQTDGPALPKELELFSHFEGQWDPYRTQQTVDNAGKHDRIRVDFKHLSPTNSGFATLARGADEWKMRIAIHNALDEPSRYGVLVHELAHVYLGHLGSDKDHWWPSRSELDSKAVEIEAEAVAFIVTTRMGLKGQSASYVSSYLIKGSSVPVAVSVDLVAKVASRIEEMALKKSSARDPKVSGSSGLK